MECKAIQLSEMITDIAAGPFGSNLKVSCFVNEGFPIIDGANLKGFKVTDNITKFVTEEKARSLHRSIAKRGDIIVTISGTLGQIAYIPDDSKYEEYLCSQRQFRVTFDTTKVYVPYLVFYFHTYEGQHKILSFANQVGVPALSQPLKNFRQIIIQLPDLDTQKKIANIVELVNGKIEQNERINNNLEQQAQAIFLEMFPNIFSSSASSTFQNLIEFSNGKKRPEATGNIPVYGGNGILAYTNQANAENCVIIGRVGAYCGNTFLCPEKCWTSDNAIQAKSKKDDSPLFIYYLLKNASLPSRHIGTGQPLMTQGILNSIPVNEPSVQAISSFISICKPMHEFIFTNERQNMSLALLRDSLLSKLMSGELDVSDIDL